MKRVISQVALGIVVSATLPAKALRRPVDNVAPQAPALASAIDAVMSGI